MLSEFCYNFLIIGLTETRLKITKENLCNQFSNGYTFVTQPSLYNAGGVGLFLQPSYTSTCMYITHHSVTVIVNMFLNSLSHHTISGNVTYDLSDHLPNFFTLPEHF